MTVKFPKLYTSLAKYYDVLENQYRDYEAESTWLASLIKNEKAKRILDVSCGTGRHLKGIVDALHEKHDFDKQIVGFDASQEMTRIAKSKLAKSTFPQARDTQILLADFLNIPIQSSAFDLAICMYWSLAGLDDESVSRLFAGVNHSLSAKGIFVFDVENLEGIKKKFIGKPFVDSFFTPDDNTDCSITRVNHSELCTMDAVDWRAYYIFEWADSEAIEMDRMKLRFFSKRSLEKMLEQAGFAEIQVMSSPAGRYSAGSPTLYFVCRK